MPNQPKKKFILTDIVIKETSSVDNPAQEPALAVLTKNKAANSGGSNEGSNMSDTPDTKSGDKIAELEKKLEKNQKLLEKSEKMASMNDEHKAYYKSLDVESKEIFINDSFESRESEILKSRESDKVVYKSPETGREYRKSSGDEVIELAKQMDAQAKENRILKAALIDDEFTKRAETEMNNLAGKVETHKEILKAIDGIQDENIKEEALNLIKSQNETAKEKFVRKSNSSSKTDNSDSFHKGLAEFKKSNPELSDPKAYVAFVQTQKGAELYNELNKQ